MSRRPAVPTDLLRGGPGRRLWSAVVRTWDLDPPELATLAEAARTLDELGRLAEALSDSSMTVSGSAGQPRPNPLLAEVRAHRSTLARLVKVLDLPGEVAEPRVTSATSAAASKAARTRWALERARAGRGA